MSLAKYLARAKSIAKAAPELGGEALRGAGQLAADHPLAAAGLAAGAGGAGAYEAHEELREDTPTEKLKKKLGSLGNILGL